MISHGYATPTLRPIGMPPGRNRRRTLPGAAILVIAAMLSLVSSAFAAPSTPAAPSGSVSASLVWSYTGTGKEALDHPVAVTVGPDGNVWVVDGMNNRIVILSPDGTFVRAWGTKGSEDGNFLFASSLSNDAGEIGFGPDGSIYVAEESSARVQRFDKNLRFMSAWSGAPTPISTFAYLVGVAVDRDGDLWASDAGGGYVSKFSPDGKFLLSLGAHNALIWPCSVGFDVDGNLMVADGRGAIDIFSLDGKLLRTMTLKDADGKPVIGVSDISTDQDGHIYVVAGSGPSIAARSYPVLVYDRSGNLLLRWTGQGASKLQEPYIVAPDNAGNMYIVDWAASMVQKVHIDFPS